jgi:hypothetical protein
MCGSGSLSSIEAVQKLTASTLSSDFNTVFKENQNILDTIAPSLSGIITKGVGQAGYTPEEDAARKSEILATNSAATRQASSAAGESIAALGGGNQVLPSGSKEAIMGGIAERGAQTGASELQQETAQNYETGRQNYFEATKELPQATSTLDNASNGLGGLANQAESGVGQTENERIQATRAWIDPVTKIATSMISGASSAGAAEIAKP